MQIEIVANIDNGIKSNDLLATLSEILNDNRGKQIILDFEKVQFVAANQLAVLSALFDDFYSTPGSSIYLSNLSDKLKGVMQKNGFGERLGLEKKKDRYHTTIPYRYFSHDESLEFERYLLMYLFQRNDIPNMFEPVKNAIMDNFLEIFNNVKEHTSAKSIHACGQFFPKSKMLYFTIVDLGETVKDNVKDYLTIKSINMQEKYYIEWALKEGNSTRMKDSPGGLGFSMISRFIELNKGNLLVMSDNEFYEFSGGKSRIMILDHAFKGTIVTIGINMNDNFSYLTINDSIEQILF